MLTTVIKTHDMFTDVSNLFRDWLLKELERLDMSQADLARETGLTTGGISHIVNQARFPNPETLLSIAKALGKSPEEVFRAAGLLPNLPNQRQAAEEKLGHKFSDLTDEEIDDLIVYMEFIQARRGQKGKTKKREGLSPPVLINK